MGELKIHESLIPYIVGLTSERITRPTGFEDINIVRKINAAYEDCHEFFPRIKLFKFIAYNIISDYYPLKKLEPEEDINKYLREILEDKECRLKLMSGHPKSEFFSVLKDITPYYIEFANAIKENKGYDAVTAYEALDDLLDMETLSLYSGKHLEEECEKRYSFPLNDIRTYSYRMKTKTYPKRKGFDIEKINNRGYYSRTCSMYSRVFHDMMLEFYHQKGFIYTPINEDLSYFQFGSIAVVEYKYADDLKFTIRGYPWSKYEFWALLGSDPKLIEKINFDGPILVAPKGLKEEALITYYMKELGESVITPEFLSVMKKIGIPEEFAMVNELSTYDYRTFYTDPRRYEDIRLRNPMAYPTLQNIISKDEEEREKYLKKIFATYKGQHPSKVEEEETYRERVKRNPKAYID